MAMHRPKAKFVFPKVNRRHERQDEIVQLDTDGGRDLVALKKPRHRNRKKRLQAPERSEAEKNSDRDAERDRVGRVLDRHQPKMHVAHPASQAGPCTPAFGRFLNHRVVA